jgi:phenylpropionate dioxygenase-like ring-hydroxylating dioxygenase large terminal subunit
MIKYVRNAWYVAAYSHEVGDNLLSRILFERSILVFRGESGAPVVLDNRCPHKGAPLSMGQRIGDTVECAYHGLRFNNLGKCIHIPGQPLIPPGAAVRRYPSAEKYGLIWYWPGDADKAEHDLISEIANFDVKDWTTFHGPPTVFSTNIMNIVDNLVDPAHTTFVHRKTIGGSDAAHVPLKTEQLGETITIGRWIENSDPVPVMRLYGGFSGPVDRWQYYHFTSPNLSLVDMGAVPANEERSEANRNARYRTLSYALLTPETDASTHYFWFVQRCFALDDEKVSDEMRTAYAATFDEDREMLAAIQKIQDQQGATQTLRLAIDTATVQLRRLVGRRIDAEESATQADQSEGHSDRAAT